MEMSSERRKHSRQKKNTRPAFRLSFEQKAGYPRLEIVATVIDTSDAGCRIKTIGPLAVGSLVFLDRAVVYGGTKAETWTARVNWCSLDADGGYTEGLNLEAPVKGQTSEAKSPEREGAACPDYYELLQLNTKADPDTIHRVYRLLAQRFHPDNAESGDELVFRQVLGAYKVLSDPEQRAAYDVKLGLQNRHRWKIFDQVTAMNGRGAEQTKRTGILLVLYTRRRNEPAQPSMTVHEMEDLLGCPKEHLEFGLWYLREKSYVARGDNGRFTITASGVEAAEEAEIPWTPANRLLNPAQPESVPQYV